MSLTSRFFKKPWQHKNPETRLSAVREHHDPELINALPQLAEQDSSAVVRLAALERINTEPYWLDARLRETDADILAAADQFLSRSVCANSSSEMRAERLLWLKKIKSSDTVRQLARQAKDTELRESALERIQSQGFLGDCYSTESDPGLAASLLTRITQLSTLERLHQSLKKTSKSKAKAVQARIQTIQSESGEIDGNEVSARQVLEQAEALARGENIEQREALLEELRKSWASLEDVPDQLLNRFEGATNIVESAIARSSLAETDIDSSVADNADRSTDDATAGPVSSLQSTADAIRSQLRSQKKQLKPQKLLADWDRAWNDLKEVHDIDYELKNEMLPILKELQIQVQRQSHSSASGVPLRGGKDGKTARAEESIDFAAELDVVAGLLEAGEIGKSNDALLEVRSRLMALPVRARPKAALGRLQRLEGRLKEMRNYQHWSNNKHRDDLIERVEALPDSGQHPDAITAALKDARREWQQLEKLETLPDQSNNGADNNQRRYAAPAGQWRRFQTACSAAFDTAKPYFEKRQSVQEQTLSQLEAFVAAGHELAEDESANVKALMPLMRKARQAIRRLDDLPPKSRGAAAGQLRGLMDSVSKRLDAAFEQVELAKKRLINEANTLSQESDLKTAIDRAKGLQASWKKSGQGRRKQDQALWKEFRAAIDPLFEQLAGQHEAREQANKETIAELESLCTQAEALCELPDQELDQAAGRMRGLVDEWSNHHPRPTGLVKRFEHAKQKLSDRQGAQIKEKKQQAALAVSILAKAVQQAYLDRLNDKPIDAQALLADIENPPDELAAAARRIADQSTTPAELKSSAENNLEQALALAVEFEFLSGLDSPPDEKSRRMDFQVKRLAERMSERGQQADLGSELAGLEARWYAALPLPEDHYDALQKRIEKSQSVLQNMLGDS